VAAGYTEAVKDFTKAIGIFPTDRDYNGRGLAYSKIGKRAEAVSDLNMAITLNPDNQARLQGEINDIKRGK
jgi:tetratricopeptide (TPR) repeat protein